MHALYIEASSGSYLTMRGELMLTAGDMIH